MLIRRLALFMFKCISSPISARLESIGIVLRTAFGSVMVTREGAVVHFQIYFGLEFSSPFDDITAKTTVWWRLPNRRALEIWT